MRSGRSVNRLMLPDFTDVVTGRLTAVLALSPLLLAFLCQHPCPVRDAVPGGEGVRVVRAEHPLQVWQ